jgi:mRNA interferase MazF
MTACSFGDIVLVPFPFTDQTGSKKRPAVVVSSGAYHRFRNDLILMPVTSQVREHAGFGEMDVADWRGAGLLKPSVVKPVLLTLETSLILRKMGRLGTVDQDALRRCLSSILEVSKR